MKENNDNQDIKLLVRLRGNVENKSEKTSNDEPDNKQAAKANAKTAKQTNPNQSKSTDKKDAKKPAKNNSQQSVASNININ